MMIQMCYFIIGLSIISLYLSYLFYLYKTGKYFKPYSFKVITSIQIDEYLIVKLKYLNSLNFDGIKICVYKDININALTLKKYADPHFSSKDNLCPIARFSPDRGIEMATIFVLALVKKESIDNEIIPSVRN